MADELANMSNITGESSESTVEIHLKTLDSHMYNFRVDKNMLVSSFKEKIANEVGLPVGQQRLIFRGKVLKDEHRLSEYHIESGHTLHLVARQPSEPQPSSGSSTNTTAPNNTNTDANAAGPRPRVAHVSHSVVLGTFGSGDQNVGGAQDISRVISAVLDSFGVRDGNMTMPPPNMPFNIPRQTNQGNDAGVNVNNQGQGQPGNNGQSVPQGFQIPLGAGIAIPTLATPIPDSLHTLSEFMNRMEQALSQNGYQPNQPSNAAESSPSPPVELPTSARGVPLPAALAVVMRHAQRLLSGPAINSLSHTAGRLEEEESITDPTVRSQIQSEAMQSGLAMQHLGALLLELGRTMLTLRVGQSHAESSVFAGPAVYISPSGPNPIMVQPFPLQTNSLFGGNANPINSSGFGPVGMGAVPRHINVHIHAGIGQRGTNVDSNQGQPGNGTAAAPGVNLQTRDSTRSENQASTVQPEGSVPKTEGQKEDTESTTSSSSAMKSTNDAEGASSSSNSVTDNSGNASTVPLGLGLGGLQPKRRSRQTKPDSTSGSVPSVTAPSSNPGGGQVNPATIMNEVIASPALDGLLSGVSSQTGIGSPDVLRNMLGQLTQNPAMMNTVNQIAQQIDSNQDLSNMFGGMGGGSRGGNTGGGFDLSSMVQQMMPIVAQAFGGGGSGSNMFQQSPPVNREFQPTVHDISTDSQVDIEDLVDKIENQESPESVFSSVVETAAHLNDNGEDADGIIDICFEDGLTHEFMEMMKRDVSRRIEEEGE